eukprot:COSAG01_NODE_61074_length_291_cov_0.812500_1_plen_34_part_01
MPIPRARLEVADWDALEHALRSRAKRHWAMGVVH